MPRTEKFPDVKDPEGEEWDRWIDLQFTCGALYYKKTRRYITVTCSHCGETYTLDRHDPFDDEHSYKADHGKGDTCVRCGIRATYLSAGRAKEKYTEWVNVLTAEPVDNAVLFRIFTIRRDYLRLKQAITSKPREYERILMRENKAPWRWRRQWYYGDEYKWGTGNESKKPLFGDVSDGSIHGSVWETINNSYLKYYGIRKKWDEASAFKKYVNCYGYACHRCVILPNVLRICGMYSYYPMLESLDKIGGFEKIAKNVLTGSETLSRRGRNPWDALRIYKGRMGWLSEDNDLLGIFRKERKLAKNWNESEIKYLKSLNYWEREISLKLSDTISFAKQKKYLEKQKANIITWSDYLDMKRNLGYEMDQIATFPKDLRAAHARCVEEKDAEAAARRAKEKEQLYKRIRSKTKKLDHVYRWEHKGMSVRMAKSATEFIEEGRTLHHCVGATDRYMSKHAKGESFILFLRYKADEPYVTIEISSKDNRIIQWFGAYDEKPEEKKIDRWLKEYKKHLDTVKNKTKRRTKAS